MRNDLLLGGGIGGVGGRLGWREPLPARAPTDLHAFGNLQGPRPPRAGVDFDVDDAGRVIAQGGALPRGASTFGDPHQSGLTGQYHRIPEGTEMPRGLGVKADGSDVIPDSPHPPTHHTIHPTESTTPEEFTQKFKSLPWEHAGKIK
jgi:hypothetical protein